MSYSQNDEETWILEFFSYQTYGRFLDIGAYTGKELSNTLALVERGWGGVCIEPSPSVFQTLLKRHGGNRNIALVNAAITRRGGLHPFWDFGGDAISTLDRSHHQKWQKNNPNIAQNFYVSTLSLVDLFNYFGPMFHFINLDVEGQSAELFMELPFKELPSVRCICVEHDNKITDLLEKAAPFGFRTLMSNSENLILIRNETPAT